MLTLRGIYGREMYETWYKMSVMLQSGLDIRPAITHRFSFREHEAAFAAARCGDSGKVIMDWSGVRLPDERRLRRDPLAFLGEELADLRDKPPLSAAAGDVVGPGPDRVGRRPRG